MRIRLSGYLRNDLGVETPFARDIASGVGVDSPLNDLKVSGVYLVERGNPTRARWQNLFNRGLQSISVSFSVVRQWSDLGVAEFELFEQAINVPIRCTAVLTFGYGSSTKTITAQQCEVEITETGHQEAIGLSTLITYHCVMSHITISTASPPPFAS